MSETYSSIQSVDTELIGTMNENVLLAANQDVLNKLGDNNGELTYDGKPVGGDSRTVVEETFTEDLIDFTFVVDSRVAVLTVASPSINENTEIKSVKIQFVKNGEFVDVKDIPLLYNENGEPCIVSSHHPAVDDGSKSFLEGFKVASLYFPVSCTAYTKISSGVYNAVSVEYYGG